MNQRAKEVNVIMDKLDSTSLFNDWDVLIYLKKKNKIKKNPDFFFTSFRVLYFEV